MKIPTPPPDSQRLLGRLNAGRLRDLLGHLPAAAAADRYLPWDQLRRRPTPAGISHEEWWLAVKLARTSMRRELPLSDGANRPLTYALPDEVLRGIEAVSRDASGRIGMSEIVTNPATRDRYLVSSLIEEAITSSQLEGAATTRQVAKAMIRTGRRPRTRDEQMILNNYFAMGRIGELRHESLTPDVIYEIHRIVTDGTLTDAGASGRPQSPHEDRVAIYDNEGQLLHAPPPADELPERMRRLCDFANGLAGGAYVPPVIRAIVVHFALAYDHPFEDGNGRTARALFYWSMLNQGYWLTEFLSISRILRAAPSQYARSFLYSEQDDADLTHFVIYQLRVIQRAIRDLDLYLARKVSELKEMQRSLLTMPGEYNHRQVALLEHAVKHPDAQYTVVSHTTSHRVVRETARRDLIELEERGFLTRRRVGRTFVWIPSRDLSAMLSEPAPKRRRRILVPG